MTQDEGQESPAWISIGTVDSLLSSHRHHITLRSQTKPVTYHSILLFHFDNYSKSQKQAGNGEVAVHDGSMSVATAASRSSKRTWYAMTAQCPHLGAPLESAPLRKVANDNDGDVVGDDDASSDISFPEDDEDDIEDTVIVCPWHEYDFSLRTGDSTTGMKACVYGVRTVGGAVQDDGENPTATLQVQSMPREDDERETEWEVVEVRPVSEAFPDHRSRAAESLHHAVEQGLDISGGDGNGNGDDGGDVATTTDARASSSILPPDPRPRTLLAWACLILNTPSPAHKVAYTRMAAEAFRSGECKVIGSGTRPEETPPQIPPSETHMKVVRPGQEQRRGKGGSLRSRLVMLHSLANIELQAINLGWDIIARSPQLFNVFKEKYKLSATERKNRQLPLEFYNDFVKLSVDEAKHFSLLVDRLYSLDGTKFGDLEVHQGLWDTALQTSHSLTARLSIIHLVHEARGLDANPTTIKKFQNAGDAESTRILNIIHHDEITHVGIGNRHLHYLCSLPEPALDAVQVFRDEVRQNFAGRLKGPFNVQDRQKAGLDREWYEDLVGYRNGPDAPPTGASREEIPGG